MVKRERHVVNEKVQRHTPFHFLLGFIKDLGFRRIILKCDNGSSTKALQDAVIHACVANGRVGETTMQNSQNFR